MDKIEIIGDKIYLAGYVVAEISQKPPASVVESFRLMVGSCNTNPDTVALFNEWLDESGYWRK